MSTPRRPSGGRRPARPPVRTSRTGATRAVPARPAAAPPVAAPPVAGQSRRAGGQPRRSVLTPQAAVLALVVCGLLASAALPLREYLSQRSRIAELEQSQAEARERVAALEAERERLQDPAYVAAEARRRLHYVLPGETAYRVLVPEDLPAPDEAEDAKGPEAPWYSQVWGSVEQADRPVPAPRP